MSIEDTSMTDIAVVGMAGRFPGARDVHRFWRNLSEGTESITPLDEADLLAAGMPPDVLAQPGFVRAGAPLDDIDLFDAGFFGFTAREAALLDPQQRIFLECVSDALEDAACVPSEQDVIGVYAGANLPTYLISNLLAGARFTPNATAFELMIHNDKDYLTTRTAYKLNLHGPCVTVQTACSTSLVAVHLACQALLNQECDVAVAGGVSVRVPQHTGYVHEEGLIFSRDGHCRPFDADASGTVFGSGAGVVVLKRLQDALRDGDHVEAVVKASATNNDGSRKVGYTAPSIDGQTSVIATALEVGGLDAATISAVEAHGTGTLIGDPIEVTALTRAFREHTAQSGYCALGSVKSNVGHLDTAAGITGLIKAILQLKHEQLVPSLHFNRPNPQIDFDRTPFAVNTSLVPWKPNGTPRRIGVSSFGIGGTNAHVILEEAPRKEAARTTDVPRPADREQVVLLSAATPAALDDAASRLAEHVGTQPELDLADVAYTLQTGRAHRRYRRSLVCADLAELPGLLDGEAPDRVFTWDSRGEEPDVVLLFPGQGTQYPGMGRGLYETEQLYRDTVDECLQLLRPLLDRDLRELLFDGEAAALTDTRYAQPALFVTEYALARLLEERGVRPVGMVGHSVGELVAACLAGVFTLPDALTAVVTRARLMAEQPAGAMLSVAASEAVVRPLLSGNLAVAAVNADELVVVSGPSDEVTAFGDALAAEDITARPLRTSHAFHSVMMDPAVEPFAEHLRSITLQPPTRRFTSNVTGTWITDEQATDPAYWARQIRAGVRFADCVRTATTGGKFAVVEAGPGHALGTLARQSLPPRSAVLATMRSATDERSDGTALREALGRLWGFGVDVVWPALHDTERRRIALPTYPFQRRRHWVERPDGGGVVKPLQIAPDAEDNDDRSMLLADYVAPRDDRERLAAGVWEEFFGISPIGVHDSFFELGGHSLLASRVVTRLRELGIEVTLQQLLAAPTIAGVAASDGQSTSDEMPVAVPDPAHRFEPFPLLEIQQAQWIGRFGSFEMGDVAAHVYLEYESDTLDLARLETAWRKVVDRHEMLRAVVLPDGRQQVLESVEPYRIVVDDQGAEAVRDRMSAQMHKVDEWPLWEVRATRSDDRVRVHVSFDLIGADVASFFFQVQRDWQRFYESPDWAPEPLSLSFRDYVLAEAAMRETSVYERSLEYWRERVHSLPPAPELPTLSAPSGPAEFSRRHARIDVGQWNRIKQIAASHGVTPTSVLVSAYAAVVGRWSKSQHFTLNLTAVNRLPFHPEVDELVGEFASFNLLEVDLREAPAFGDVVRQVQHRSWQDLEHRHVSGVRVLRELARVRGSATGALMPIVFTSALMQDPVTTGGPFAWLGTQQHVISQTPQVSLDHFVMEVDGALDMSWHAVEELFPAGVLDDMFDTYRALVESLVEEDAWQVPGVTLPAWQETVFAEVNATEGELVDMLLHEAVFARALSVPDVHAVWSDDRWVTFGELGGRAVRLAESLRARGVGRGTPVGIGVQKGWRQTVAVLGVLAAGGIYVPIAPDLPEERRQWLAEHSGVACVVSEIDEDDGWQSADIAGWECPARPDDVAYVIYTSGSTGTPKGVAVTHRSALNTLVDVCARFGIGAGDRVLGLSSLSFDLSVFDVFGVLGVGGALVLPEPDAGRDPGRWWELVTEHQVTVWNTVPALAQMLAEYADGRSDHLPLRVMLLSGDWLPVGLPDRVRAFAPGCSVVSLGGATEAAVWSIFFPVQEVDPGWVSIPYGKPLRNQSFTVVNERGERCPVWVPGELLIGGAGVARGYWNDQERTARSFADGWYRTGDLGRYWPDGVIEFLGREDFQVKIGGYRIELGEIEHALLVHPQVAQAVVTAAGDRGHRRLVAYVVCEGDDIEGLRTHLDDRLPSYMVPSQFVVLDRFPLSGNGKVDRAALPDPAADRAGDGDPIVDDRLRALVEQLTAIVTDVLGRPDVGPHDNFFDLGGDSILGIQAVTRANALGLPVTPQQLFEHQTVAQLAGALVRSGIAPVTAEAVPLTPYQRVLLADRAEWVLLDTTEHFDVGVAEEALAELMLRHPVLRLVVDPDTGEQRVPAEPGERPYIAEIDLSALPGDERAELMNQMVGEIAGELDPATGEMVELAVFHLGEGERKVVWVAHRLVIDDRSWQILLGEFASAYDQVSREEPVRWLEPVGPYTAWARNVALPAVGAGVGAAPRDRTLDRTVPADWREETFAAFHVSPTETLAAALLLAVDARVVVSRSAERAGGAVDLSATVGRFTTLTPLPRPGSDAAVPDVINAVKDGFRTMTVDEVELSDEDVLLHEVPADWRLAGPARLPADFAGPEHHGTTPAGPPLEISAVVVDGTLRIRWRHRESHDPTGQADRFEQALDRIVAHCRDAAAGSYRTSDFPLAGLDEKSLGSFLARFGDDD
ncbi:non-ribosomal peptide synthetase/type I polyketide synthase [Lentzea sp.]|uniref:non-ribosomal peptide synthetase/type I polyketide synthase n=1 Tax=Lentzea sp. TaxID=56099 RepID=UPI002C1FBAD1|nr:non-ribosomal peptide synthetase/type I polyketide synthase [Lentzea sp.]HUQ55213.1 amino acid adenylation domain-containing protein [Lentzea sp.]